MFHLCLFFSANEKGTLARDRKCNGELTSVSEEKQRGLAGSSGEPIFSKGAIRSVEWAVISLPLMRWPFPASSV